MTISIFGGGSIGIGWAVVFARCGRTVAIYDSQLEVLRSCTGRLCDALTALLSHDLLNEPVAEVLERVTVCESPFDLLKDGSLILECIAERLDIKRNLYQMIDDHGASPGLVMSSSSALMPSDLFQGFGFAENGLVCHPGNPPHLLPVVEVVPSSFTAESAMEAATELCAGVGMYPIRLKREIEGFVFNRLQGALLREAYALVEDDIVGPAAVDEMVSSGLGLRWAFNGPFETACLNTKGGISAHAERMGPAYARMARSDPAPDVWSSDLVGRVEEYCQLKIPCTEWGAAVRKRELQVMKLLHLKSLLQSHPFQESDRSWP